MKILHIAKNIPNEYKNENDIILRTISEYKQKYGSNTSIVYPLEYVPQFSLFHLLGNRYIEKTQLRETFTYNSLVIDVFRYFRLPFKSLANSLVVMSGQLPFNKGLLDKLNNQEYDVVHSHYILPDNLLIDALNIKSKIKVITIRQGDINNISGLKESDKEYKLYKLCILGANKLISPNYSIKNYIENKFNVDVTVIPHACDMVPYIYSDKKPSKVVKIVTSANLINRKNIDWVINSVNDYRGENEVELFITGNGPEYDNLLKISSKKITFLGSVSQAKNIALFSECDFFVLPSEKETFGRVYIEALSCGLPCVALKNTGLYGYPVENAMLFVDNYTQCCGSIYELIDNSALRLELSKSAFKVSRELFSWDNVLGQYHTLYVNLQTR
jgi:glycosyltransferase involved in cell wall biosynthesis